MGDTELTFNLSVKVNHNTREIEHAIDSQFTGYTQNEQQTINQIIDEDIAYLLEDIRRRVLIIK